MTTVRAETVSRRKSRPARVFYLWEWGAGYGHLRRFLPLAQSLRELGCDVVLAVKEPRRAREVFVDPEIAILSAPVVAPPPFVRCQEPRSLAGLAWNLGVNDARSVMACVRQWKQLLLAVRPTHVIADFGLLGSFVAQSLQIPTARIGTGFGTPPQKHVLASMCEQPVTGPELDIAERIEEIVRAASVACQLPTPRDWNELYRTLGPTLLVTVPDFDPYQACRAGESYVGIWDQSQGREPTWKSPAGVTTVAYLKPTPHLHQQCHKLVELGLNLLLVCDGANASLQPLADLEGISLADGLVSLDRCRDHCSLIVCNANHGMTLRALSMSVPVLMLPLFIEQRWNAGVVERLGLGVNLSTCPPSNWQDRIVMLLESSACQNRLRSYADYLTHSCRESLTRAVGVLQGWIAESS